MLASMAVTAQSQMLHHEAIAISQRLHQEQQTRRKENHIAAASNDVELHAAKQALSRELFIAEMKQNKMLAKKEAIRDVWQQHNELTQTKMILSTLMFGCAYSLLFDGQLPEGIDQFSSSVFAFCISSSLLELLVSIVALLALYARASHFDLHRPLRRYEPCKQQHSDFREYYICHCGNLETVAAILFSVGSATTLFGCCLLVGLKHLHTYHHDSVATSIFCVIVAIPVVLLVIGKWVVPGNTRIFSQTIPPTAVAMEQILEHKEEETTAET